MVSTRKAIKVRSLRRLFTSHHRWMKKEFTNGRGRFCLEGGLCFVYGPLYMDAKGEINLERFRATRRLEEAAGVGIGYLAKFNDSPETTFADIKRVIHKARV